MNNETEPVKVDIVIENPSLTNEAFYSLCFITENDEAPRTLKVEVLKDLLDNGYDRTDLAYNFCVGVFAQQSMSSVYIRAKRSYEGYQDAYLADDNSTYYYIVLQTKDLYEIDSFGDFLYSSDEIKLLFFSGSQNMPIPIIPTMYQRMSPSDTGRPNVVEYQQIYSCGLEVVEYETDSVRDSVRDSESKDFYLSKAYGCNSEPQGCTAINTIFKSELPEVPPIGALHARYRVNNNKWIDLSIGYEDITESTPILELLSRIQFNDYSMVSLGDIGEDFTSSAFRVTEDDGKYKGLTPNGNVNAYIGSEYEEEEYIIDFRVTTEDRNDIVFMAFGEDITVKSCFYVYSYGGLWDV